jgi:hypothetical protein
MGEGQVRNSCMGSSIRPKRLFVRRCLGLAAVALAMLALPQADAYAGGGASIASAPTVVFGQHTFGTTETGTYQCYPAEFWNLSLGAGDQVTIDWASVNRYYAYKAYIYPAGTTDFSINNVSPLENFYLGENNHAEGVFATGTAGSYPLIFVSGSCNTKTPGPYDFTVTDQHSLVATLKQYLHIKTTTVISASASLASGAPAPDGLVFTLTASWPGGGTASYNAASAGGALTFPLALPETAKGKKATIIVTRPADAQFLAAKSAQLEVPVGRGSPPVVASPCALASRHARAVGRRYRRLKAHAAAARGANRRRLRNRAHRVARQLRAAHSQAATACGTA